MTPDLASQKQALRDRLRFRRRHFVANLDPMGRLAAFHAMPDALRVLLDAGPVVGAYAPWGDEPDIRPLLRLDDRRIALPHHSDRTPAMTFRLWEDGDALRKGPWGSPQPPDSAEIAHPDIILCPLVGFDRHGGRLGQGGGHYDRFFAENLAVPRIGIGWSVQEVDTVPIEQTDILLDAVLTEQEYIITGDRL